MISLAPATHVAQQVLPNLCLRGGGGGTGSPDRPASSRSVDGRIAPVRCRCRCAFGSDAAAFFDFFAGPPEDFESRALAVLDEGLAAGDSPLLARRATRLLQAYELSFWDALAEGL